MTLKNFSCVKIYYDAGNNSICFIYYDNTKIKQSDLEKNLRESFTQGFPLIEALNILEKQFQENIRIEEFVDSIII